MVLLLNGRPTLSTYDELWQWSVDNIADFWELVCCHVGCQFCVATANLHSPFLLLLLLQVWKYVGIQSSTNYSKVRPWCVCDQLVYVRAHSRATTYPV